jgi:Cu(I)-responsive transcriptional regulator
MNIGQAAQLSGLPAKTIRYYESIGLVRPAARRSSGYRDYDEADARRLRFIAQARALGFVVEEVRALLALYEDKSRASADVKKLVMRHIGAIDAKITDLQRLKAALAHLAKRCHGDDRPECPILDSLDRA